MVVLLLTGIFAINPSLALKTSAVTIQDEWVVNENNSSSDSDSLVSENDNTSEGTDPVDGGFGGDEVELPQEDMDAGISLQSVAPTPTLAITVSNSNQTIDAVQGGNTVYGSYNVGITGSNVKDYTLSIKADAVNLVSPSQASTPTTVTGAGGKTGNSMTANTWGYKLTETSTAESSYGTLNYASLPTSLTQIANGTVSSPYNLSANKKLVFAAKFSDTAAPGTYKGHITLSAVVNQAVVSAIWSSGVDSGITDMQDIGSGFCASGLPEGATIKLKDNRDQQEYMIVKLRDQKCWMQQNLRLNLVGGTTVEGSKNDGTAYHWTNVPSNAATQTSSASTWTTSTLTAMSRAGSDANGNCYSWCAATAGTCSSSGEASASICPKGWRLPKGNTSGDFYNLFGNYGANLGSGYSTKFANVQASPYGFPAAGYIYDTGKLISVGTAGYYWSSTAYNSNSAYYLSFDSSNFRPGTTITYYRYAGFSVRCVATS